MNKRIVAITLLFVLILSSTFSFAAPGDFIHTGLKKIYRYNNESDVEQLLQDILDGADIKKFYREIDNGKYVNIFEEEERQMEEIEKLLDKEGLTNPDEIQDYLIKNQKNLYDKFDEIIKNIAIEFKDIPDENKGHIKDYKNVSNALILDENHYSTPEPGFKEGSTKISRLYLPKGASKWLIKVLNEKEENLQKDKIITNGIPYTKGQDIHINKGQFLGLYAVDSSNRLKAYANIKINEDMIKTPRELAPKLDIGKIFEGEKYAGTVVINELGKLPEGASKWQIAIYYTPVDIVYKDAKIDNAMDYTPGNDIIIANENELQFINDNFIRYLLLLAVDEDENIKGYNSFEIGKDIISKAPTKLVENTHYKGPMPGDNDGTTKFTNLHPGLNPDENMKDAKDWKVLVNKKPIFVPKLDGEFNAFATEGTVFNVPNEIEANIGDYLLLAAVDNSNYIKGYRIFQLTEDMIKGKRAPTLTENIHYSKPEKGSAEGTTRINKLDLGGVEGATKWMYKVGENLTEPILNKMVYGSSNYTVGQSVRANVGDDFLLLATDNQDKVKAFAKIKLNENMIKNPPPVLLREGVNYVGPIKGDEPGTTKFEALSGSVSIGNNPKWMYIISHKEPEIPELNSTVDEAEEFKAKDNIGKNLSSGKYLMLLATDDNYLVKGYAIFKLNDANIKMPPANTLKEGEHFSKPEKGTGPGTTRISTLNPIGIEGVDQWRIKISREPFLQGKETIELNSIIPQTSVYREGSNIRAETNDWLLLLATDSSGRVKAYAQIQLEEEHVRKPNATLLIPRTNYTEPEAGTVENSTRFGFLDFSTNVDGANKWMYKIGKEPFGAIELDSNIEDTLPVGDEGYNVGKNIEKVYHGDYLLLLATDSDGKVKGYREFRLTERNIRGGPAKKLDENNYELEKGNRPGTTKFNKLVPLGMEGNIRWKYKLMDSPLPNDEKPYLNSVLEDTHFVNEGQDIEVRETENNGEPKYGYLLLLAVDGSNRTKGYAEINIDSNIVKEHAPIWNVKLEKGLVADSVKITGTLPENATATKYIIGYREFSKPAIDEVLNEGISYDLGSNIPQVRIGNHIGIYAVDKDNKIKAFNSLEVTTENIMQGSAQIINTTILEGSINNGGEKIVIMLEDAQWANDLKTNPNKRNALYYGFKANSESQEWAKVVDSLIKDGSGAIDISDDNKTLTILLPETKDYNITQEQEITLMVPAVAIENAINPIEATDSITIKPTIKATISGDVVNSIVREDDIIAGGKTIVIELEDGNWIGDINSDTNVIALINGFKVVNVENPEEQTNTNWHKIKSKITSENIIRNSSKKLTITLPSMKDQEGNRETDFGVNKEIISLTIPAKLVQGSKENTNIVATPTFTLYPNILQVVGEARNKNTVYLEAPDGKIPRDGKDIWEIKVTTGTLKEDITNRDIVVAGLPRGLKANVDKVDTENNIITLKVLGTAAAKIEDVEVKVKVKGEAVEEPNSLDSEDIMLYLKISKTIEADLKEVIYDLREDGNENEKILNIYLMNVNETMEYSIDSTNGINGKWEKANSGTEGILIGEARPMKIWVREKAQPKVFHLVGELKYRDTPTDVKISSYTYRDTGLDVIMEGNISQLEYSIDGDKTWTTLGSPEITLDSDSDLRLRYRATVGKGGNLPSLPTKKLNGIYLGDVNLNVVEGIIENTTTNMEYSLNSTNGLDGSFSTARNISTSVKFVNGVDVWIRERGKGNEINKRKIGTVGQMKFSEVDLDKIDYNISEKKFILKDSPDFGLEDLQYKIANDPWKDVGNGNNIEFKAGSLQLRKKGDKTKLPSVAREKAIIAPPTPAPELSYDDVNHTIEKIGTEEGSIYEYSKDKGENWYPGWQSGEGKYEFEAGEEVWIREMAGEKTLASEIQTIRFTPNLSLANVYLDAGKSMIMNTTAEMEYSLNSVYGFDGQWYRASAPNTSIPLKEGMVVHIREGKKPTNWKRLTDSPMEERILNKRIIEERIDYSIEDGTIYIKTGKDLKWLQDAVDNLQYRNGNSPWINIKYTKLEADKIIVLAYNVDFQPGKLEFRLKGNQNYLPSKPVEKVTIKASASAPKVIINDVEDVVESINGIKRDDENWDEHWDKFEYSVDNGPWISGRYLKTEDLSGERILRVRMKATNYELPSQEVVIHFTENLPLEHVKLSTYVQPMELNGTTTQMEYAVRYENNKGDEIWYRISLPDGSPTMWMDASNGNTVLPDVVSEGNWVKIIIRDKSKGIINIL